MSEGHWQLQAAKQRFSEVVRAAQRGEAQIVTRHGQEVAVVIDIVEYRQLRAELGDFKHFLQAGASLEGLDLDRDSTPARVPELTE